MARAFTILSTPGCPNVTVLQERLAAALARCGGPASEVSLEQITDPAEASRRGFHGSPALLLSMASTSLLPPDSATGFACRTYRTEMGVEGAPSVEQLVAVLERLLGEGVQLMEVPPVPAGYDRSISRA